MMTIQQIIEGLEEDMLIAKNKFSKAEQKLEELKVLLKQQSSNDDDKFLNQISVLIIK